MDFHEVLGILAKLVVVGSQGERPMDVGMVDQDSSSPLALSTGLILRGKGGPSVKREAYSR